ncbi:MAG: hypothetical protein QW568_02005 [Candidatus Anstonellaceae archaeon]
MAEKINHAIERAEKKRAEHPSKFSVFFDKMVESELAKSRYNENGYGNGFLDKNIERISKIKVKILEQKRKLLSKLGVEETQILGAFGVRNSFYLAKLGSKVDILQELLTFALGALSFASFFVIGAYALIKTGMPASHEIAGPRSAEWLHRLLSNTISPLKIQLIAMIPVAFCMRWLNRIGVALDIFQQIFMESITNSMPAHIKPKAEQIYKAFTHESLREIAMDTIIQFIPLPLVDTFRRIRAIKLELRQLGHIDRMEKLYKESLAAKEPADESASA